MKVPKKIRSPKNQEKPKAKAATSHIPKSKEARKNAVSGTFLPDIKPKIFKPDIIREEDNSLEDKS